MGFAIYLQIIVRRLKVIGFKRLKGVSFARRNAMSESPLTWPFARP